MYVTIMFLPIKSEVTVELALVIQLIIDLYYIPIISRWHSQAFIRSVPAFARCKVSNSPTIAVKDVYSGIHVVIQILRLPLIILTIPIWRKEVRHFYIVIWYLKSQGCRTSIRIAYLYIHYLYTPLLALGLYD